MANYKTRTRKSLPCKKCGEKVDNLGEETTAVTCWKCVNKMMSTNVNTCDDDDDVVENKKKKD